MKIKRLVLKLHNIFKKYIDYLRGKNKTRSFFCNDKLPKIFLIGTPEHDNLGDHAIALAELLFIKNNFQDYRVIEISVEKFWLFFRNLKKRIRKEDIVFFSGGGNMGDTYYDEQIRLALIKEIQNPVIVFPQTIYFKNKNSNNRIKERMIKAYNSHSDNILLCAREKESFDLMKELFPNCNVYLCPDMAFYLKNHFIFSNSKSDKIGICLRDDFEQLSSNEERINALTTIMDKLGYNKDNLTPFDTRLFVKNIWLNREKHVKNLLSKIASFKLCFTDRLHAVIFSLIVGTHVIALTSETPKIKSTIQTFFNDYEKEILFRNADDVSCSKTVIFNFESYYSNLCKKIYDLIKNR